MTRRRTKAADKPAIAPPPFRLAQAAEDSRAMWVLDVSASAGRRVWLAPLAKLEDMAAMFAAEPGAIVHLWPADTAYQRHKWGQIAKKGWHRAGWWRPRSEAGQGAYDEEGELVQRDFLQSQIDEWRELASRR